MNARERRLSFDLFLFRRMSRPSPTLRHRRFLPQYIPRPRSTHRRDRNRARFYLRLRLCVRLSLSVHLGLRPRMLSIMVWTEALFTHRLRPLGHLPLPHRMRSPFSTTTTSARTGSTTRLRRSRRRKRHRHHQSPRHMARFQPPRVRRVRSRRGEEGGRKGGGGCRVVEVCFESDSSGSGRDIGRRIECTDPAPSVHPPKSSTDPAP